VTEIIQPVCSTFSIIALPGHLYSAFSAIQNTVTLSPLPPVPAPTKQFTAPARACLVPGASIQTLLLRSGVVYQPLV
jgi:hypothetical protein